MTSRFDRLGRRRSRRRIGTFLIIGLALAGLLWLGLGWRVGSLVGSAQTALLEGDPAIARERLESARTYRVRPGRITEMEALVALATGDVETGRALLARARDEGVSRTGIDLDRVGRHLCDRARYEAVRVLAEHRETVGGAGVPDLWRGEAALAAGDLERAEALLSAAADGERKDRLRELMEQRRGTGVAWSVHDRTGRPLIGRRLEDGAVVSEVPELGDDPLGSAGALAHLTARELDGRVTLTLDLAYQRAAHAALGRFTGAFVALEPRTGQILALVDHPAEEDDGGAAFRRQFEPGSIVKMLTLTAALDGNMDLDGLFPLNCTGNMTLDRRVFYDWRAHGTVENIDDATAVSCNLAFAAMGLELGQARLDDVLRGFGFDLRPPSPGIDLSLGRLQDIDPEEPRRGLASRAVGLENLTITPLHLALLSATLAHDGTGMRPHLVASLAGLGADTPYARGQTEALLSATSEETARRVAEAMRHVVSDAEGTGRRASIPGLEFAMKTGTAGERDPGLNTVIMGWAPLESPAVAFGFIAEHAGKAELEGARIVRDFLTTVRNEFGREP